MSNQRSSFFFSSTQSSNTTSQTTNSLSQYSPNSNDNHHFPVSSSPSSPMNLAESNRRPSGSFSRMAFSIYGNNYLGSSPNKGPASSPTRQALSSSTSPGVSKPYNGYSVPATSLSLLKSSNELASHDPITERTVYQSQNEILTCAKAFETPNLMAMATQKNLQLLKLSATDISLEQELLLKLNGNRANKFGTISDLCFGHQQYGRHLAVGTINGSIHLYHLDRGSRVKNTLIDHQRAVNSLDFNRINGHTLLSGSQDGKIKIWDLRMKNAKSSLTLNCNADAVRSAQFNHKKVNLLAAVFDSGVVEKWDIRKPGTWERRINAHTGPALTLDWHPELDYVVTAGRDKQIQVWNLATGSENREPSHVINTSGSIYKAKWCKGSGNRSIYNTDIATCFLNDTRIQIWNINRSHIPKHVIESHSGQVTQLVWRTPKHLVSCSKDKTLIQHDVTKEPFTIDNMKCGATTWNPRGKCNIAFVKQEKNQFDKEVQELKRNTTSAGSDVHMGDSHSILGIPSNVNSNAATNSDGSLVNLKHNDSTNSIGSIQHKRRSGYSSSMQYQPKQQQTTVDPPVIMPAHIPVAHNDEEIFKFLSSNYLLEVPDTSDLISVLDYNANIAAAAGCFRDSQTWHTIKMAILLDIVDKEMDEVNEQFKDFTIEQIRTASDSRLGTSFGSISESDDMKRNDVISNNEEFRDQFDTYPRRYTGDTENVSINGTREIEEKKLLTDPNEHAIIDEEEISNDNQEIKEDAKLDTEKEIKVEETNTDKQVSKPLDISSRKTSFNTSGATHRYSFTGSSVDFDNEKALSPISVSPSSIMSKSKNKLLMSKMEAYESMAHFNSVAKSIETRQSRASDTKSQLTTQLKQTTNNFEIKFDNEKIEDSVKQLQVPWNPVDMINQAVIFEANQGEILLCAIFAILFHKKYPGSMKSWQAEEWINTYHDVLTSHCMFANAASLLKIASKEFSSLKALGQRETSVKTFCMNCHKLLLNEASKEKARTDDNVEFGFWYCDKCGSDQGLCIYCNEPVKGNAVGLIGCGHIGHFGCFRTWFVEEGQNECPGCGTEVY
ncbi:Rtc1 protein [Martiniozyma asiatica (nom. inval.)]|nr:Rtc1 protein [Martiniozyma asiatica]